MGVAKSMTLRGGGGPTLSVTMTLIFPKIVWTCPLSESSIEENTTVMVSSYDEDSEYFSHKNIITHSIEYITAI